MQNREKIGLQTAAMIEQAEEDRHIGIHKEDGKYYGGLYVNHPTPSGSVRYLLTLSDKRRFDDEKKAEDAFRKALAQIDIIV